MEKETEPESFKDFRETEKIWAKQKELRDKDTAGLVFSKREQARRFIEKQPIFYDKAGIWWIWNFENKCWKLTDETDILNLVESQIKIDVINSKERQEILTALELEGRKNVPRDAEKTWIQFRNGIIDIKKPMIIIEPTPDYFITNPIPWEIGQTEDTPNMDRIFSEWVGTDYAKKLYQILAYCLLPDYPIHRIFCFIGSGMNGKSKFLELLRKFIGEDNCCSTELDTLLTSRFEVTRLHKKLVCQMGETNFNEMNKTSTLKKLSGGDLIGFEYKRKDPFEDKNYAKIIISTNNLPTTSDKTIGFYRRWDITDFPNQFSEKKDILAEIPEAEYPNLAKKCLNILSELLEKREFHNEGSVEDRMKKYEDHSDPLEKFMKEFVEESYSGHIFKHEFEKTLNQWCVENRFRQISDVAIGKKMKDKGIQQDRVKADWVTSSDNRIRAWMGISWKNQNIGGSK